MTITEPHILEDDQLVPVKTARTDSLHKAIKRLALDRSAWLVIIPACRDELEQRHG